VEQCCGTGHRLECRDRRQPFAEPGFAGRERKAARSVSLILVFELTILVLAIFLGIEVISKVPTMLHTPLMSGTNAIHGIVLVGAILVAGRAGADTLTLVVGFFAVVLGTANVVGGFVVTDRMLEMFKQRRPQKSE
jgi:H+-translocating NAD(P) transhydrogenase subunit alpha